MDDRLLVLVGLVLFTLGAVLLMKRKCKREGYRDPIYLNRKKYVRDIYPRANGSIYGFPVSLGGTQHLMSGYAYYPSAY